MSVIKRAATNTLLRARVPRKINYRKLASPSYHLNRPLSFQIRH